MSFSSNRLVTFWKFVESQIRRTTFKRRGVQLSVSNNIVVQDALCLLVLCWYDLLSFGSYPTDRIGTTWLNTLCDTDFFSVVSCFKSADGLLHNRSIPDYEGFKHSLKQDHPNCGALIAPLKGFIEAWTKDQSISAFSQLHCAFTFISRLNLHGLKDLEAEAVEDYLANERRLREVVVTSEEHDIITKWFPRTDAHLLWEKFLPKHGPGAVADTGTCLADKYKHIGVDGLLHYLDNKVGWTDSDYPRRRTSFDRCSRVVMVPKSVSKLRTICAEPTVLQWYQQGFLVSIKDFIRNSEYLRQRIDLDHQEYNRDLAWEGSIDGSFSTIDLSAASDSVSWQLIQSWFSDSALREILWCTRSRRSLMPDGSIVDLNKFAPMGSALCFPVECIVFSAIIEASIREVGDSPIRSRYRVYGDDLVIETKYAKTLIDRLNRNGFIVNIDKSFTDTELPIFRESCGGEYIDGMDVTPIRLSRQFDGVRMEGRFVPSRILACIDLCNRTYTRLPSVRRYVISKLLSLPSNYRPLFSDDGEHGVFTPTCTNYHLHASRYYHNDYQCDYVKHGDAHVKPSIIDEADEDIRLFEWLRSTCLRKTFNSDVDTQTRISSPGSSIWGRHASPLRS